MPEGGAVAIQGEAGSFSHAAALETHGAVIRLVPCATFVDLFRAVEGGAATSGVVPIENTLAGPVHENYDLVSAHPLHLVAETELRIRHCLIASPRTRLPDVRRVASHPLALAQCQRCFTTHPDLVPVPAYDTVRGHGREARGSISSAWMSSIRARGSGRRSGNCEPLPPVSASWARIRRDSRRQSPGP